MILPENQLAQLVKSAIVAADPGQLLLNHLQRSGENLVIGGRSYPATGVTLVSVGKAAVSMALTAAAELASLLQRGIVVSKTAEAPNLPHPLHYYQASHPVPDRRSLTAAAAVKRLLRNSQPEELVLCLISGGTSALLTEPVLPLPHWQQLNQALLSSGCPINGINTVRQHFDGVKGGGLARWAAPAACVSFILSDVIGNQLEHIGSGPTVFVDKDYDGVAAIMNAYAVWNWLEPETAEKIKTILKDRPDQNHKTMPALNQHFIIGDVSTATAAVARKTAEWDYQSTVVSNTLTGEAREIGRMAAQRGRELPYGSCLIWGGESTVTLKGNGRGGRNQEIALAAAIALQDIPDCVIAAFSTDAEDGPMPVAGAFATSETAVLAAAKGLEPAQFLDNNDSYTFFEKLGTGHLRAETGTNVNDVLVVLKGPNEGA